MSGSYRLGDTIAAVASPPGGAARGIVRVSGPQAIAFVAQASEKAAATAISALKRASVVEGAFLLPAAGGGFTRRLPALFYVWPGARSYTREPLVELHLPGVPPLLDAVLEELAARGVRPAEPGEFTLRAFLAGRLDLTQAEAVLGTIAAQNRSELDRALAQLAGGLARPLASLREELLEFLAHLEAGLDFVEEEIEFLAAAERQRKVAELLAQVEAIFTQAAARDDRQAAPRVVLAGLPNAGKSSLFNRLAPGAEAIVSSAPGATRDYLRAAWDVGGRTCELIDTAGWEETAAGELAERVAAISAAQRESADLVLWCFDGSQPFTTLEPRAQAACASASDTIRVRTKCDLPTVWAGPADAIPISSRTGAGLEELRAMVRERIEEREAALGSMAPATAVRCRDSLRRAAEALRRALAIGAKGGGEELIAAELRLALAALGEVAGATYTDDLLDRIFRRFCIGK